jgi:hypothetical protein
MASRITTQRTVNAAESRGPITHALRTAPSIDADIRAPACGTVANAIARRRAAERRKRSCKRRQRTLEQASDSFAFKTPALPLMRS